MTTYADTVAVIGLGYVGTVTAACLAARGATVIGVDIDESKAQSLNAGAAPFAEPELDTLLAEAVEAGRLRASTDAHEALLTSSIWIVTVGTPSGLDGDADLRSVHRVASAAHRTIAERRDPPLIVLTSTVPPGTSERVILPTLEQGGHEEGRDFHFVYAPEFLREGSAVADYLEPERTIVGGRSEASRAAASDFLSGIGGRIDFCDITTAEFTKYTDNAWHALKVVFANEIARIGNALGVDSRAAMQLFVQDHRLNISPAYLQPGFAFGGSCLPKDVRTLSTRARAAGIDAPIVNSILASNEAHVHAAVRVIEALAPKRLAIVGLAFKSGTDDVRESPALPLVRRLATPDREVHVYDPLIDPERMHGANALQLKVDLPDYRRLLTRDLETITSADIVVITQRGPMGRDIAARLESEQVLVDVAGSVSAEDTAARYVGLAWP